MPSRQFRRLPSLVIGLALSAVDGTAAQTPVPDAAERGDLAAVRALIAEGADVTAVQGDGATALHWAVYREQPELVALLIEAGADVEAEGGRG